MFWLKTEKIKSMDIKYNELVNQFAPGAKQITIKKIRKKGNGIFSLNRYTSGTVLLEVPLENIICRKTVEQFRNSCDKFASIATLEEWNDMSFRTQAMLFLCYLWLGIQPRTNKWDKFLTVLPLSINTPAQWPEKEVYSLQGTSIFNPVCVKRKILQQEWLSLNQRYSDSWPSKITLPKWVHADALFHSRCLESPFKDPVLAPVIDLCNHSSKSNAKWSFSEDAMQLYLDKDIDENEEVTINYGSEKGSAEFLFSYGFLPEPEGDRITNVMKLLIPEDSNDSLDLAKRRSCKTPPMIEFVSDSSGELWWHAPFLFFSVLNVEDFTNFKMVCDESKAQTVDWEFEGQKCSVEDLPKLVQLSPKRDLYILRVFCLAEQLADAALNTNIENMYNPTERRSESVELLKRESFLLKKVLLYLRDVISKLLKSKVVVEFIHSQTIES